MNIHVSQEIIDKWPNYEFVGVPLIIDGRKYIRAFSKCFGNTHYYSYDDDFFWFDRDDIIPMNKVKGNKGA